MITFGWFSSGRDQAAQVEESLRRWTKIHHQDTKDTKMH